MDDSAGHNIWRSYSDMMSGLLLLFILIMAVCLMQAQKNYMEKLAEQAKQLQTQNELDESQATVSEQQAQLDEQAATLDEQAATLDEQEKTLAEQASALEELQQALENQQLSLNQKESELEDAQATVAAQQTALDESQEALDESQAKLDEANNLMQQQQERIDQIIGVKADLISALDEEFRENQVNVQVDTQTGAILLDSSVLFDFNESTLTDEGTAVLNQVLPIYCGVLLSEEYSPYVAEVIIDGYTDTTGEYASNLQLSQERAYAVAAYLIYSRDTFLTAEQGEELLAKLTANGKSMSNPIRNADGSVNMDASRRVEIKFRLTDEEMLTELQELITQSQSAAQQLMGDEGAQAEGAQSAPAAEAQEAVPEAGAEGGDVTIIG